MSRQDEGSRSRLQRAHIAAVAARLMAEDGVADTALAKRKAVRYLGLPETAEMPDSHEIDAELRAYQRLFQSRGHDAELDDLRRKAIDLMVILQPFRPYLTGSVLDGTAGQHAEIDIQLFVDSAKDVEIFLLNQRMDYRHSEPRSDRAEAVFTLCLDDTVCNLVVYPAQAERVTFKTRGGKVRRRARLDAVRKLLSGQESD